MKKMIAMFCVLTLCLGVLSGCGNAQKKESAQPAETETIAPAEMESAAEAETEAALTETKAEPQTADPADPEAADPDYLFADLDLSDLSDLEEAADPKPVLIVFENMGESIWEKEIGIEPAEGMGLYEADVLAIEKGEDGQTRVKVGYREQSDLETEDVYFQTMLYSRDGEGIALSEDEEAEAE